MAATIKIINILLFLCLISQGYCQPCSLSDLSVKQSQTGAKIKGKPEWLVNVTNNCACAQNNVVLNCPGFQTVEPVDPNIVTYSGDNLFCLINDGNAIYKDPFTFKYAWDHSLPLSLNSSQIACS